MTRFAQVILGFCLVLFISSVAVAQKKKVPVQPKKSAVGKIAAKTGVIELQAGIIYKMGGVQPVARTQFFFLDESLEKILQNAGLKPESDNLGLVSNYTFAQRYPNQYIEFLQVAEPAIKPHIRGTLTTDFNGNATSTALPVGTYYIMGVTETRGGMAAWNLQTEVKIGTNKVILDNDNAASAF